MPTVSPSKYERLKKNCCQYNYFQCQNGRVTSISLYWANLYGTLNISLIPDSATYFEIFDNQISKIVGKLSTSNLKYFVLDRNNVSGPIFDIPSSLTHLYISDNQFSGPLDLTNRPNLTYIDVSSNLFEGSLNITNRSMIDIEVSNNYFTTIIRDPGILYIKYCDLSLNYFDANSLVNITGCTAKQLIQSQSSPSSDCNYVIDFARAMNTDSIAPGVFGKIVKNCCNSGFATCQSGRVTDIQFPYIYIEQTALYLNGTFGKLGLPPMLSTLTMNSNHKIYGKFPKIPANMTQITIGNSYLSGDLPVFPPTLTVLSLKRYDWTDSNTFLTGNLVLFQPTTVLVPYNQISSISITNTSLLTLSKCDLSFNALLNDTNVGNLTMCNKLFLAYAPPARLQIETTQVTVQTSEPSSSIAQTSSVSSSIEESSVDSNPFEGNSTSIVYQPSFGIASSESNLEGVYRTSIS
eukprot:NODE_139_length_16235_cov_0.569038.p4 type:complete len:464 gc:universal NODE_139_length_16235_cov_0.569038:839-2230(+)